MELKETILINFGEKVREIRKEKGLSQEELADKADLHRTYIGMIERAEKNITLLNIQKITLLLLLFTQGNHSKLNWISGMIYLSLYLSFFLKKGDPNLK